MFDAETYDGQDIKPEFGEDETGNKFLKKTHEDVIRWRYATEGERLVVSSAFPTRSIF